MVRVQVTAANITSRLYAAVCAHFTADASYGTTEPGYIEAAEHVTALCGYMNAFELAERASREQQDGETERAEIMAAELERRARRAACSGCGNPHGGPDCAVF